MCLALRTRLALVSFRPKYAKITPVLQATLAHKMAKNHEISVYFSIKQDLSFMSRPMVGEMVQNSQSLYSFTFNALIDIHEYIYSHSTTEFTFKKYIYSHLPVYFLFTIIFAHIYEMSSFTFNELYPFTFTIEIFIQHFLRITFAHQYKIPTAEYGLRTTD